MRPQYFYSARDIGWAAIGGVFVGSGLSHANWWMAAIGMVQIVLAFVPRKVRS